MKRIVYWVLFFWVIGANVLYAQSNLPLDDFTQKVTYRGIEELKGLTKDQLHIGIQKWYATNIQNEHSKLIINEKQEGVFFGTNSFMVYFTNIEGKESYGKVGYSFSLECKDGRYRYTITDFKLSFFKSDFPDGQIDLEKLTSNNKSWEEQKVKIDNEIKTMITDLKKFMTDYKKNADW